MSPSPNLPAPKSLEPKSEVGHGLPLRLCCHLRARVIYNANFVCGVFGHPIVPPDQHFDPFGN
jgi:hypothetical protein